MKSKIVKAIIACIVVAALSVGGYYTYKTYFAKKTVATSAQYLNVSTRKMNLEVTVQGTGAAYAAVSKDIAPNNNGTLKDLNLKVGDTVTSGQKLFVSDSDDIRKNVTSAQNNLTKQNLTLTSDQNAAKVDDNKVSMDQLSVNDATSQLADANKQLSKMTVTSPIGGTITAVSNSNGDSVQSGKSVLTVVDMNSIKVKVSVDELDIGKIKSGQKATIKFDALKDKSFDGSVESIAQTGTTSNNVTTYDVVVAVNNPSGIKLGMNANVTIAVESKENALVIPAEALVENNGQKFVRVESTDSSNTADKNAQNTQNQQAQSGTSKNNNQNGTARNNMQGTSSGGKLVAIKTGLETENYIEVTEGLTEGQKVLIKMPQTSSTNNNNNKNNFGGFGGNMGGGPSGGMGAPDRNMGGQAPQGGNNSTQKN